VTDKRFALACSKFDKGGRLSGWSLGGMVVASGVNTVSRIRAARRRKGKMLVGHVRYEWLIRIDAKDRRGLGGKNQMLVIFADPTGESGPMVLDLTLGKNDLASTVASEIVRRASGYQALHVTHRDHKSDLEAYALNPTCEPSDNGFISYVLPQPAG
jgi:hypothetical protein